jgi:hypothetical protein
MTHHYEGVEAATRSQLTKLPPCDLEAVIRFFESMAALRSTRCPESESVHPYSIESGRTESILYD